MLLLSTSTLVWYGLHRIFDMAKTANYDGIDLALDFQFYDFWDAEYIKSLQKLYNLPVRSVRAPIKDMSTKHTHAIIKLSEIIGAKSLTFAPPYIMDKDTKWFWELQKLQAHSELDICVQNVEAKFLFFVIPEYRNANLEKIKSITGSTSLDLVAIENASNMDILRAQAIFGSSMKNVYLADKEANKKSIMPGRATGWLSYLPLESFLMKLCAIDYAGNIIIKIDPYFIGAGDFQEVMKNLESVRAYYKKYFIKK